VIGTSPDGVWLRVGEVARRTGLTVRTLHHYDELGLLVPSGRSAGDYRLYSDADLRRLLAIQHLKSLGLSLDDIAAALDDPGFDARDAVERHIAAVEARLAAERELLERLKALRAASGAGWDEVLDVIALTERLRHPDAAVRVRAALGAPPSAPLPTLVDTLLAEPDAAVRETLTWAIARHGAAATPLLVRHLRHRDPAARQRALHVLGKAGDRSAVPAVAAALADPEPRVAATAAFALGRLGGPDARAALLGALGAPGEELRAEVVAALGAAGPEAAPGLRAALAAGGPAARAQAAEALGILADEASGPALAAALADPDADVRFAALLALSQLHGAAARDAIAGAAAHDDPRVRALARRLRR